MNWSTEWPTEPGNYWFYGWAWSVRNIHKEPPRLEFVTVKHGANHHPFYVCSGAFMSQFDMYKNPAALGVWMPIDQPALPDVSFLLED